MNNSTKIALAIFLVLLVVLTGYSMKSEEDVLKDVKEAAESTFNEDGKIAVNHEMDGFSLYLPENLEVEEESNSNVILKDENQTYILFYNSLESPQSDLNYKAAQTDKALLLESFIDEGEFGYIRVLPDEGDGYELQVGIGGVKITTYTTKGKIDDDASNLMKIARSIYEEQSDQKPDNSQ